MLLVLCWLLPILSVGFVLEGSEMSYAQFRKWYPTANATIEFEFLTSSPSGILLYTDDGGYYDFVEVKLVDGAVRLRYNLGNGAVVLTAGRGLNDGLAWHKVQFVRNFTETTLVVDGTDRVTSGANNLYTPPKGGAASLVPPNPGPGNDIEFGNFTTNSYVYVGGLPFWYNTKLAMLALPSVVFEPRFKGSVRNLLYAHDETGKPKKQEVMAYNVSSCFFGVLFV